MFVEGRIFTDEMNGTADQTHPLGNGLRTFGDDNFVKGAGVDVGSGWVHAVGTAAVNELVICVDGKARAAQTAEQWIARAAAFADDAHVGNGL